MIRLIKPYIGFDDLAEELQSIFAAGIFTKGDYSKQFPQMIADYTGAKHAFLTTSATTALTMSLRLLDVGPGDEVAVSDFSFPASVNVIEDLGATPVFVDVSLDTYNMIPEQLEQKLSTRTKAVIFVDALGNPSGLDRIAALCKAHNVPLIEDAACAIGSRVNDVACGALADLTCFSFHPRKLLCCGEGGAITTNSDRYAEVLVNKLNHGADESGQFVTFGYNYRMPELSCLLGCKQMERLDEVIAERRTQTEQYRKQLQPHGFIPQAASDNAFHNMQSIVFRVPNGCDRNALISYLRDKDIETTLGTYCLSACAYYREKYDSVQPNAFYLQENTITLPSYPGLPVDTVGDAVTSFVH
jgi:dTDP-4-amino-4,6-dideoxygalactose transaminase